MSLGLLIGFGLWTAAVCLIDVAAIGPMDTTVGLSTLNQWAHRITGVHLSLYVLTDWLGLVPVCIGAGFGLMGLIQWISRRSIRRVDNSLLILGCFYLTVMAFYLLFEKTVINYRPVLIEGRLEASYPSSTTLLTACVMPTAMMQCRERLGKGRLRMGLLLSMAGFAVFMILGRLWAGVHWLSDIVGGLLLSLGLVMLYTAGMDALHRHSAQEKME